MFSAKDERRTVGHDPGDRPMSFKADESKALVAPVFADRKADVEDVPKPTEDLSDFL
jgi:hypothetical protein